MKKLSFLALFLALSAHFTGTTAIFASDTRGTCEKAFGCLGKGVSLAGSAVYYTASTAIKAGLLTSKIAWKSVSTRGGRYVVGSIIAILVATECAYQYDKDKLPATLKTWWEATRPIFASILEELNEYRIAHYTSWQDFSAHVQNCKDFMVNIPSAIQDQVSSLLNSSIKLTHNTFTTIRNYQKIISELQSVCEKNRASRFFYDAGTRELCDELNIK